jgi:hypothetical protein
MIVVAIIAVLTAVFATMSGSGAGTPRTTADRITGLVQFAKLRAEARRTTHRVRFEAGVVSIWEATTVGFGTPVFVTTTLNPEYVQAMDIPTGVIIHSASSTTLPLSGNTPLTQGTGLPYDLDIKPDGSTNGGTLFITDTRDSTTERFRVFFYKVTGTALSRELW